MKDNFFSGIGSYWLQFFKDRDILESFGAASTEMLSSVYTEFSNIVLSLSHEDIPVYERLKWDALVLNAADTEEVDGKYRFALIPAFNTRGLRRSPAILSSVVSPKVILNQGYDFTVGDDFIEFTADPFGISGMPVREVGGDLQITLWCPVIDIDTNRIWRNYGHFIKRWRYSSPAYKNFVRGMFHTWMHGPIVNRIETGLNIIAGLPVARGNGNEVVIGIVSLGDKSVIRTSMDEYSIPADVSVRVGVGDILAPFQAMSDVVKVVDYLIEPGWWQGNVDSLPPEIGSTNDLNKAFDQYLKYNTFLVRINIAPFLSAMSDGITPFSATEFNQFIFQFKPSYTYPLVVFSLDMLSSLELSDYLRESIVVPALDIYTRPNCYRFGFGSEEELFLYYFDRVDTYFDGSIKVFTSFPNYDPVPLLHFDQPLVRFDKDALSLSFDGSMLFDSNDWTAITFAGCEEDRLTIVPTLLPQDEVSHLAPEFNGDFAFDGQIMWGYSEIPFADTPGYTADLDNREDIVTQEILQATADYTDTSQLYRLFDGEWDWDDAATFASGPLFAGNGLLFDNPTLSFSELPQLSFDGSKTFGDIHGIRLDSGYEQQIDMPAAISYQEQRTYTQFLFNGGFPFDGGDYRVFSDDRSEYDYAHTETVVSYDDLSDAVDEFVAETTIAAFREQYLKVFNGEKSWDDAAVFAYGPLFDQTDLYFNLSVKFGEIAESAFDGNMVFGGGGSDIFASDYGSSVEDSIIFSGQDTAPNRDVMFDGIDTFGGMEGMVFSADRAVYDSTARTIEQEIEELSGMPDEDFQTVAGMAFYDEYHTMFNGSISEWNHASTFSSGPLFNRMDRHFDQTAEFGESAELGFNGATSFNGGGDNVFSAGYGSYIEVIFNGEVQQTFEDDVDTPGDETAFPLTAVLVDKWHSLFNGDITWDGNNVFNSHSSQFVVDDNVDSAGWHVFEDTAGAPEDTAGLSADTAFEERYLRMFDGENVWNTARLFSSGPLFSGNDLLFELLSTQFGELPELPFGGSKTFSNVHPTMFDSHHEDSISISVYSVSQGEVIQVIN